ncbi:hypothetical protein ACLBWS_15715 [Brucellaceae bacterium D45D]
MVKELPPTPLASHLAELAKKGHCHNFHAVPWPAALRTMSGPFAQQYRLLLGAELNRIDGSWSGSATDSFFKPSGPLAQAQDSAAKAFGADATYFATTGTTTSNQIALLSLYRPGARILMDCNAHQSLLFAADGMDVVPAPRTGALDNAYVDVAATARILAEAAAFGRPFDILVLAATGYDGRKLCLERVLPVFVNASPKTVLIIDEAWSALDAFVPHIAHNTALAVCARLDLQASVLVTQSAHKTMAALRQGSYLHVLGKPEDIERVRQATYRIHTTSPSWPILLSLDLARAHAQVHGAVGYDHALELREQVETELRKDPRTVVFLVKPEPHPYYRNDPLVLLLNVGARARAIRDWLFTNHHVFVTIAGDNLVVRFHIGTSRDDISALLAGLQRLATKTASPVKADSIVTDRAILDPVIGMPSCGYIVAYPPGVPLARPGEIWTEAHALALARERTRGAEIHFLSADGTVRKAVDGECLTAACTTHAMAELTHKDRSPV